jgi:hypothetical protein
MNKKTINISMIILLLISVYGYATKIDLDNDILDQSQSIFDLGNKLIPGYQNAQSFIPSLNILSKVELYLYRKGIPSYSNIEFSIKDSKNESNLSTVEKSVDEISTRGGWVELDFEDFYVQAGKTYYLVCNPIGGTNNDYDNFISWGACLGNRYLAGSAWDIHLGIWKITGYDVYDIDYCFKTYGSYNNPPNKPTINGNIKLVIDKEYHYTFISSDPEEDEISYFIDWGDNTYTGWTRTLLPGEYYNSSHNWSEKGSYTIKAKAKDIYGGESDWATLTVSMPKIQINNQIIQKIIDLLERFTFFEKILTHLHY